MDPWPDCGRPDRGGLSRGCGRITGDLSRDRRVGAGGEVLDLKKKYGDERRTQIVPEEGEISLEDLIKDEDMVVTISHAGYIKRNPVSLFRAQRRGGKGLIGAKTREEDFVQHLFVASTHAYLLFLTNRGRCYWLKVHEIDQAGRAAKGRPIVNLIEIDRDAASRLGITAAVIDEALYNAFGQRLISTIFTQSNQYRVVLEVEPQFQVTPAPLPRSASSFPSTQPLPSSQGARSRSTITRRPLSLQL